MIDARRVRQRLDLVGANTGSIVGVATWCALHAAAADVVLGCLAERLCASDTPDATRASLVYVVHELLVTCASRGVSDAGKRAVLRAVSGRVRPAMVSLLTRGTSSHAGTAAATDASSFVDAHARFLHALDKVLTWWSLLNLFPATWLDELRQLRDALLPRPSSSSSATSRTAAGKADDRDAARLLLPSSIDDDNAAAALPGALHRVTAAMTHYLACKERWQRTRALKHELDAGDRVASAAQEAALRALDDVVVAATATTTTTTATAAAVSVVDATAMASWLAAERAEVSGSSDGSGAPAASDVAYASRVKSLDIDASALPPQQPQPLREGSHDDVDEDEGAVTRARDDGDMGNNENDNDNDDEDEDVLATFY